MGLLGLLLLAGCTPSGDEGGASISTAPKAPKSDFVIACPEYTDPQVKPDAGKLPALSLECLGSEGDPVSVSGTPPRPVVVNLWASWCPPCREEMPFIDQLAKAGAGAVDVLGVATSDTRDAATAFAVEYAMTFPSVLDPKNQILASQGIQGLPATLFLDAKGVVVDAHVGPYKSYDDLEADVAKHLKVSL